MIRKIIQIDEEKCSGCGAVLWLATRAPLKWSTARLSSCGMIIAMGLATAFRPAPANAITFIEREAAPYDDIAVQKNQSVSQLSQWPVQIKLAPVNAPYFNGANLLIAADCTAFAFADFHHRFIRSRITLVDAPSWMLWTIRKNLQRSSKRMIYKASLLY